MLARMFSHPRFLVAYSALVTLSFAVSVSMVFVGTARSSRERLTEFDRIRVHRIDVVEPDGTPRLIIADRMEYPGSFYHGREIDRPDRRDSAWACTVHQRRSARKMAALIYGGATTERQALELQRHLSFDQYEQDQTVVMGTALNSDGSRTAGISLNDMPDQSITPDDYAEVQRIKAMPHGEPRAAAWAAYQKKHPFGQERASLEREADGSVGLALKDKEGRVRLQLRVETDGSPIIELLNEEGKTKKRITVNGISEK